MSVALNVNNSIFNYPTAGEPKGWGEDATAWAEEVTIVLNDLKGPNDILQSTANIQNGQPTAASIAGLIFDPGKVRSATITYNVYRITSDDEKVEYGELFVSYIPSSGVFSLAQESSEDGGIIFDVTNGGQVQYTTDEMLGTGYAGIITFRAKTLDII